MHPGAHSAPSAWPTLPGTLRILDRAGSGATGSVYRARDEGSGRVHAVKILDASGPEHLRQLQHEFRIARPIRHPNLVRLDRLDLEHRPAHLVMEWLDGCSLDRHPELSLSRLREGAAALASALLSLHDHGVMHRDVHPGNIHIDTSGRWVLLDFGLSKRDRAEPARELAGTPAYMSPEALFGAPATPASDAYALGAVIYERLTGSVPGGEDLAAAVSARFSRSFPRCDCDDPTLAELTWELLHPDPLRRLPLREAARRLGVVGPSPSAPATSTWAPAPVDHAARMQVVWDERGLHGAGAVASWVREAQEQRGAWVLASRTHADERAPFRGVAGCIDALVEHLQHAPWKAEVQGLMAPELALLFPEFEVLTGPPPSMDRTLGAPHRTARAALRRLLLRVASRVPVVLWLHECQWVDDDSVALLRTLMEPPEPPGLLLLWTGRQTADARTLDEIIGLLPVPVEVHRSTAEVPSVSAADLTPAEARVHTWLCAATRPLTLSELSHGGSPDEVVRCLDTLIARGLALRTSPEHGGSYRAPGQAERPSHEASVHGALADAILAAGHDPSAALHHLQRAGREEQAAPLAIASACRAAQRQAHHQAADLWRLVASLPTDAEIRLQALRGLADALARCGRGEEAADALLELADLQPDDALDLWVEASELLLFSGQRAQGVTLARKIIGELGVRFPSGEVEAFATAFVLHNSSDIKGLRLSEAPDAPADSKHIDVLQAMSVGLSASRPMTSGALGYRYLRRALRTGPGEISARAMATHAAQYALFKFDPDYTRSVRERARGVAGSAVQAHTDVVLKLVEAGCAWAEGRLADAADLTREMHPYLERSPAGLAWHRGTWVLIHLDTSWSLGRVQHVSRTLPHWLSDARSRGDLHMECNLLARVAVPVWCRLHRFDEARAALDRVQSIWPDTPYDAIQFLAFLSRIHLHLWQGEWDRAHVAMRRGWARASRALVLAVAFHRSLAAAARGRVALGRASADPRHSRWAARELRRVDRMLTLQGPVAEAERVLLAAGAHRLAGRQAEELAALAAAEEGYRACGMTRHALAARQVAQRPAVSVDPTAMAELRAFYPALQA